MDSTTRKRLNDIRRLMEAAGSVGEAEAAAAAFQRMILKHNLTAADLEGLGTDEREAYKALFIQLAPNRSIGLQWRLNLIYVLAEDSFCVFIRRGIHGGSGWIVGQSSNQEAVRSLFETIVPTVERLAEQDWRIFQHMNHGWKLSAAGWKNSFKIGFSAGLHQKMQNERRAVAALENKVHALVVVKGAELQQAVEETLGKTTMHKGSRPSNSSGYQRGVEKGLAHELRQRLDG